MFDAAAASRLLGYEPEGDPPHRFAIGELGYLVLEGERRASVVLAERTVDTRIIEACGSVPETKLQVYLSSTPGGLLCYSLTSPGPGDDTELLIADLEALVAALAEEA